MSDSLQPQPHITDDGSCQLCGEPFAQHKASAIARIEAVLEPDDDEPITEQEIMRELSMLDCIEALKAKS